jgi:signal peptidase II
MADGSGKGVWLWGPLTRQGLIVAALVCAIDQAFKTWMIHGFDIAARRQVELTPFFDLVMAWNYGVSYGLFAQDTALGQWLLVGVKALAVIVFWVWLARSERPLVAIALGLVIGGALGNAIDRSIYGAVADFFYFHIESWDFHWYIFNLADVAITAGAIGLIYDALVPAKTERPPPAASQAPRS